MARTSSALPASPRASAATATCASAPIVAFSFNTREYSSFNKPTLLAIVNWYLDHPNREGALPYVLIGFSFSSDFLAAR
jgi:hypothetical protein